MDHNSLQRIAIDYVNVFVVQTLSTSCPQCRTHDPKTHKIYLELNEDEPNNTLLEGQLRECRSKITQLQQELIGYNKAATGKGKNMFSKAGNSVKCQMLEETLESTLEHNEKLEKQLKDAETKVNNLQKQYLELRTDLDKVNTEKKNLEINYNNLQNEHNRIKNLNDFPKTQITSIISEKIKKTSFKLDGVQIKPGFNNMINYIMFLCNKMNVHNFQRSDIVRTVYINENSLFVQFKDEDARNTFLRHTGQLKYYNETEQIVIYLVASAFFNNDTLFDYALNLKMFNYKSVFRRNKKVMARRDEDEDPIRIYSREHVEELIEEENSYDSEESSESSDSSYGYY